MFFNVLPNSGVLSRVAEAWSSISKVIFIKIYRRWIVKFHSFRRGWRCCICRWRRSLSCCRFCGCFLFWSFCFRSDVVGSSKSFRIASQVRMTLWLCVRFLFGFPALGAASCLFIKVFESSWMKLFFSDTGVDVVGSWEVEACGSVGVASNWMVSSMALLVSCSLAIISVEASQTSCPVTVSPVIWSWNRALLTFSVEDEGASVVLGGGIDRGVAGLGVGGAAYSKGCLILYTANCSGSNTSSGYPFLLTGNKPADLNPVWMFDVVKTSSQMVPTRWMKSDFDSLVNKCSLFHVTTALSHFFWRGPKHDLSRACSLWVVCGGNLMIEMFSSLAFLTISRLTCETWPSKMRIRGRWVTWLQNL